MHFDELMNSAMIISLNYFKEIGPDGWFIILKQLNTFLSKAMSTMSQSAIKQVEMEKLSKFVLARKDIVFRELPLSISLKDIVNELDLDIKNTKKYYDLRASQLRAENEYINLAGSLLKKEH